MPETTSQPKRANRLVNETSPYLLQHAHNPVDWYPWGEEALERAAREDRLILLSIGYSACHWCHVMERESFENDEIAVLMNEHFVNIKVDREERPDLDDIYMAATVAMNHGQGGWPMTVFLTPDREPVFAGTYFPPADAYGRPGFASLLKEIARAWRDDRPGLRRRAAAFAQHLRGRTQLGPRMAVGEEELRGALDQYAGDFDSRFGGFGSAPKFPPAVGLMLLLRLHRRFGDPRALEMVEKTLDAMARGGMYDQIGGGFCRYATDRRWLVPHFEKMLYDNALLVRAYLEADQVTGNTFYRHVAAETLDYVLREMTAPEGGVYSSTDADSEGEEGKFFVWTPAETVAILGERIGGWFNAYYDITRGGNWEGRSIPNCPRSLDEVARKLKVTANDLRSVLAEARRTLYDARARRVRPALDDKILTAWNGLMIGAFAEGFRILGDRRYLDAAGRAADFVLARVRSEEGRLLRTYRKGRAHLSGYLEDYAYLSEGLVDLFEAGGSVKYLREAERLLLTVRSHFADPETGAFYNTAHDHEELLMRYREGADGATPSGNAVAAGTFARVSYHLARDDFREFAIRAVEAYGQAIARHPRGYAKSLMVTDFLLEGPVELALVGSPESPDFEALHRAVGGCFLPNRIQAHLDPSGTGMDESLPLLAGKNPVDGRATLYVCRNFTCDAPVTDPAGVPKALAAAGRGGTATTIGRRIYGHATTEGTARYATRFESGGYRSFGATGLVASAVGFGAYRVDDQPEHREAVLRALLAGVNVLDTSTNYTDGGSERVLGSVLRDLIESNDLRRDEVILISKIGYVQGQNLRIAQEREAGGNGFPEMVKVDERVWHCIHPAFLEDQLTRSLDRLGMETLDACLLHNPEYYLTDGRQRGADIAESRREFDRRIERAFEYLESQVEAGRIRAYGVSSNTMVSARPQPDAVSLARLVELAAAAGGSKHHFRVVQFPLNLFERGAVEAPDGGDSGSTALALARTQSLAVLTNRPLNAFLGGSLIRLAEVDRVETSGDPWTEQLARVAGLERTFREQIAGELRGEAGRVDPARFFLWAEQLEAVAAQSPTLEQWAPVEGQVRYAVNHVVSALDVELSGDAAARWSTWRDAYVPALLGLLETLRARAASRSWNRVASIHTVINRVFPEARLSASLSQKALWTVASTPGVSCVLTGMRRAEYVDDAVGIMAWGALDQWRQVYRAVEPLAETGFSDDVE